MSVIKVNEIQKHDATDVTVSSNLICTGTFTSEGIDDNATSVKLTIADSGDTVDVTGNLNADTLTVEGATACEGSCTVTGAFTSQGIDDNANANAITIDSSEDVAMTGSLAVTGNVTCDELTSTGNTTLGDSTITTADISGGSHTADKLILGDTTELTIASGVITVTGSIHTVDTESDGASDDLDTINGETTGQILVLSAAHDDRTVVVRDDGNIVLAGAVDFSLDHTNDRIVLIYDGTATKWVELSRSSNTA